MRNTNSTPTCVDHGASGHFGDVVSRSLQDGGDPADFVVLTNNDYEEHDDFSARDFDDNTALIVDDQVQGNGDGPADDDLVQLTLGRLPTGLSDGTFTLSTSDPSAVRFFDDQGQELTNLSLNLASPSGYLAGLTNGDVDVWMEGLHKSSDLEIDAVVKVPNYQYSPTAYEELTRDSVHMLLAEWNFVGKSGNPITTVAKDSQQLLLDQLTADPAAPLAGDDVFYKNKIDGLPSSAVTSLTVTSDSISTDSYVDDFGSDSSVTQSSDWSALFAPEPDTPDLTATQLTALKNNDQLNVVHNPAGDEKLQTKDGNNFPRKVPAKQQDDGQKIYDLLTADSGYGEKVKFVLDYMDWNNDGSDYHKRLVFQSLMGKNFAEQNGIVYAKPGGTNEQTKEWAIDGLRLWAAAGVLGLRDRQAVQSGNTYFARIARQWARHFYWQVGTGVPALTEALTPAGGPKKHASYNGSVDPNASPDAAVLSASRTFAFLYLFSRAGSTAPISAMYPATLFDHANDSPWLNSTPGGLPRIYLWVFSNKLDPATGITTYEVNIPTKFGMNLQYFERDSNDLNNERHNTVPSTTGPTAFTWPDEDQLHHFAGFFYLGALSMESPLMRVGNQDRPLVRGLEATFDYPADQYLGDYNLGVVGYDLGYSYEGNPTDITEKTWQELSITFAQANQINGRTSQP